MDNLLGNPLVSNYLTRAVSSPTSDPGKAVLFGYVHMSICPYVRLSGLVQRMHWTDSVDNCSAAYHYGLVATCAIFKKMMAPLFFWRGRAMHPLRERLVSSASRLP